MILLTGSTGFVGGALLEKIKSDYGLGSIKTLGRKSGYNDIVLDLVEDDIPNSVFDDINVVIHCAAQAHVMASDIQNENIYKKVNVDATLALARKSIECGVKRFIFISSIKVNGESTTSLAPFRHDDSHCPSDLYGKSKSIAEKELTKLVRDSSMELVVIRPTLVYGPNVKANFISLIRLAELKIPLPFKCISDNRRSLVSITNLVDLIITCVEHPRAGNQVFLASDGHDISTYEMVSYLSNALGKACFQLPVPKWCFYLLGRVINKQDLIGRLLGSLQVDIGHTKMTLGWEPPQSLKDGFNETTRAFLKSKRCTKND